MRDALKIIAQQVGHSGRLARGPGAKFEDNRDDLTPETIERLRGQRQVALPP
jgi:hypothetical protein